MRKVGDLENIEKAKVFRWYLISQKIETKREEAGEESTKEVWVYNDSDLKRARQLLEQFLKTEDFGTIEKEAKQSQDQWEKEQSKLEERKKQRNLVQSFQPRVPALTYTVITLCVAYFILHFIDKERWLIRHLLISQDFFANSIGIKSFREIQSGQVWRLFSPIFIHNDFFHLAFNMYWLFQFGKLIEPVLGSMKFVFLILALAIPSNLVFYLISGPVFGGMSGVAYGLFFYMWAHQRYTYRSPYLVDPSLLKFFVFFYVFSWLLTVLGIPVANTIHGVGALMGILVGYVQSGFWKRGIRIHKEGIYNGMIILALLGGGILTDILSR